MLTRESVSDISRTIKLQQFFPAIGREVNGLIEILDGTRRRAACIFNNVKFEILVTKMISHSPMHGSWRKISRLPENIVFASWGSDSKLPTEPA